MASVTEARRRAERCFAVARSTTFEGERANAIERGTKIAEAAGLDLASFDIPGRAAATRRPAADLFGSRSDLEELFRTFEETLRRQAESGQRFRTSAESLRAAAQVREELLRREQRRRSYDFSTSALRADAAVSFLWHSGISVRQAPGDPKTGARRWSIPDLHVMLFSDGGVVEVAQSYGFRGKA